LLSKDAQHDHAVNIEPSYKEMVVGKKLHKLRTAMIAADHTLLIGKYYDKLRSLVESPLYDCFMKMPKPAIHHVHLTACASLDFLIQLTYRNNVYYS